MEIIRRSFFGVAIVLLLMGCISTRVNDRQSSKSDFFIYLSHTRLEGNDSIYKKVYDIDFSKYNFRLLGGDLAQKSFGDANIIGHLDSVFDFKSKRTLLSLGNHDRSSDSTFFKHTKKRKYGVYQEKDVSFIVIDSQDSLSSIVGNQKQFLFQVLDTITTSKVILLSHKLIFMDQHAVMDELINEVCNGKQGDCFYCHNKNNFQKEVYPELIKLRNKGKEVFWIGGDLGKKQPNLNIQMKMELYF